MIRCLSFAAIGLLFAVAPARSAGISGEYIEARTCDVWAAPCFANGEMNLAGKNALMAWKVKHGTLDGVRLDGLAVAAVISASDTIGLQQTASSKAFLLVDERANAKQRAALIQLAKKQGGDFVRRVVGVRSAPFDLGLGHCKEGGCAHLEIGKLARVETRCIDCKADKKCGNEVEFYPPLGRDVNVKAAMATENTFTGSAFRETWKEANRRGAYVGTFEVR
ncbi:MAG TPA: DUF1326 domain-containing protein [Gemmataceae bacterium]|nr:DUF1326 domain-containing protein [Gemmataceae bacterium]